MISTTIKNNLVQLNNVCFAYGSNEVLEDISFQINANDFLAVLGPSGSGKTTLIKIILGLLKPKKGDVKIMGKAVHDFKEWDKIGYVSQRLTYFDPFFPASVKEVVAMGFLSRYNSITYDQQNEKKSVDKALECVGMKGFKSDRIGRLSRKQQKKIAIARAIVNRPEILILDEPATDLSAEVTDPICDILVNLNQNENMAIVSVTNETGWINQHVKKIACIDKFLMYHGALDEFFESDEFKQMMRNNSPLFNQ